MFDCSSPISVSMVNYSAKRQLQEDWVYLACISSFIERNQGRNPIAGLLDIPYSITSEQRIPFIVKKLNKNHEGSCSLNGRQAHGQLSVLNYSGPNA